MALAKMKRIQVIGELKHRESVLRRLQELGFVEVEEDREPLEGWTPKRRKEKEAVLERELADIGGALSVMEKFHRQKPTFIQQFSGIKTMMTPEEYRNYLARGEEVKSTVNLCRELESSWTRNENQYNTVINREEELKPWIDLDIPLSALGRERLVSAVLARIFSRNKTSFYEALAKLDGPKVYAEEIFADGSEVNLFILCRTEQEQKISEALVENQGTLIELGEDNRTPREILKSLEQERRQLLEEREHLVKEIATVTKRRPLLQAVYDEKSNQLKRLQMAGELPCSEKTFLLDGWIMAKDFSRLKRVLKDISPSVCLNARDPEKEENVPVEFENHSLIRPFEVVVQVYGYPAYGDIDPTPAVAPFFFIFFGLTLADVGYGLVLSGLCWYLLRTVKMAGMAKKLFNMLFLGGIASLIFGVLMSGFFADLIRFRPVWFDPTLDPNRLLVVSLVLGLIQMYLGIIIKAYSRIKAGKFWEAIFEEGLWLFFLTSILLLLAQEPLGISAYADLLPKLALVSAASVILSKMTGGGNLLQRILRLPSGIFTLYNAISFFSDLLSYSRLLALGLSSAIIGQVVNFFVRMTNPQITNPIGLIAGLIIFVGGHLLNLILSVLGSYVHSSRLQYIEFFNKFYEAGGRPFRPLTEEYKYVELVERR